MNAAEFCPTHKPKSFVLSYLEHAEWAAKQRGEQRECPTCKRWLFRSEFGPGWSKATRPLGPANVVELLATKLASWSTITEWRHLRPNIRAIYLGRAEELMAVAGLTRAPSTEPPIRVSRSPVKHPEGTP
jgi:hypothetical protein